MNDYIREQSAVDIISNSFQIYAKNFRVLFLIMVLPVIPLWIIKLPIAMEYAPTDPIHIFIGLLEFMVLTFVTAPITIAVSDYYLGNKPGVRRSYKRLSSVFGKFIWTFFLTTLFQFIGFILLIIPGIVLTLLFLFAMTTVPLERRGGMDALKRSAALGKGYRWRNFGIILLTYLILFASVMTIAIVLGITAGFLIPDSAFGTYLEEQIGGFIGLVFGPIGVIPVVLLYYDMRVRKENYDNAALSQDMVG